MTKYNRRLKIGQSSQNPRRWPWVILGVFVILVILGQLQRIGRLEQRQKERDDKDLMRSIRDDKDGFREYQHEREGK